MSLVETTSPAPASDSEKFGKLRDMAFFKDFGEVELWEWCASARGIDR